MSSKTIRKNRLKLTLLKFTFSIGIFLIHLNSIAQVVDSLMWETNNSVYAINTDSNYTYIGGSFTAMGPRTGYGALFTANSSIPKVEFPWVNGQITATIPDNNGGWYIGGTFTRVGTYLRNNLAHINANKTVDTLWNPNVNNAVQAIVIDSIDIYIGGNFTSVGGTASNHIAKLNNTNGNIDPTWNGNANNNVYSLTINNHDIYVGGSFTTIGGTTRNYIAKLNNVNGNSDNLWNPNANNTVQSVVCSGNNIYAGGYFTTIGGLSRNFIAKLDNVNGNADASWNTNANSYVFTILINGNDIYVGGLFTNIGGLNVKYLAKLNNTSGSAVVAWYPNANSRVLSIATDGNYIYVGGFFTSIGGQSRNYLAKLDYSTGTADLLWNPNPNGYVYTINKFGNDILAGGNFNIIFCLTRNRIARLHTLTGIADTIWNPGANNTIYSFALGGNYIYAGGDFYIIGGIYQNNIARFNISTGSLDISWNPNLNSTVYSIVISGNDIYIGGYFTYAGGQPRNYLAKLNDSNGNVDLAWNPNANNSVNSLAIDGNDIYAGGTFTTIGGQPRNYIAKLNNTNGLAVISWNPSANNTIYTLALNQNFVFVGGDFTTIGGQSRNRIAKLNKINGNADLLWNPNATSHVYTIAIHGNSIYAGGNFMAIGGQNSHYIAKLNITNGLSYSFLQASDNIRALAVNTGYFYAGGLFTNIFGTNQTYIAKISQSMEINIQPLLISLCVGENTFYSVELSDSVPVTYQWQDSTSNHSWQDIIGATGDTLYQNAVSLSMNNNKYHCVINYLNSTITSKPAFLVVHNVYNTNNPRTICSGSSYLLNGHSYSISGNYIDSLISVYGCDSIVNTQLTVNSFPDPAQFISGATTVCQGQDTVTYVVPPIPNATSYSWTLPGGATGTSNTNTIRVNYSWSSNSGNISVRGQNNCGYGITSSLHVTANPIPLAQSLPWTLLNNSYGNYNTYKITHIAAFGSRIYSTVSGQSGIFYSVDHGSSWTALNHGITNFDYRAMVNDGSRIYAGTYGGVFVSSDNGTNWTAINNGLTNTQVNTLTIANSKLYAGTQAGFFVSTDNGANWIRTDVGVGTPIFQSLAIKGNTMFAIIDTHPYISNDGITWIFMNQDFVFSSIIVNGSWVYVGGVSGICRTNNNGISWTQLFSGSMIYGFATWDKYIFAATQNQGLLRSDTLITSWTAYNNGILGSSLSSIASYGSNIYVGNIGGQLYSSTNLGSNWNLIGLPSDGMLSFYKNGSKVYAGTQFNSLLISSDFGHNWIRCTDNWLHNNSVYAFALHNNDLFVGASQSPVYRSSDYGSTWSPFHTGIPNYNSIQCLASNSNYIFAGLSAAGVYYSDGFSNWTASNTGLSNYVVNALAIENSNIYAGTNDGMFLSTNNGTQWSAINSGILSGSTITSLAIYGTKVFAGTSTGIYLTTNNGTSWTSINNGLTNTHVISLATYNSNIFAGTMDGVFLSEDTGVTWVSIKDNFPDNLNVNTLTVDDTNIYIGTKGSNIWKRNLTSVLNIKAGMNQVNNCGDSIKLRSSTVYLGHGSLTYIWSPASTLNFSNIPNPTAKPHFSTTYYVTVSDGNISAVDSVFIPSDSNIAPPTIISPIVYCQYDTTSTLSATGSSLLWYLTSTGGTGSSTAPTPSTVNDGTTIYYVSQTINGCEGPRASIEVIVKAKPTPPVVTNPVTYIWYDTPSPLIATGSNLLWYNASVGGTSTVTTPIPSTSVVGSNWYYVSQTVNGCESSRAAINVNVNPIPISNCNILCLSDSFIVNCNDTITLNATVQSNSNTHYTIDSITYSPPVPYNSGTLITVLDDEWSDTLSLPFNFYFFGISYNEFVIGSNGAISFNTSYANGYNQWKFTNTIPGISLPHNSICCPYHDIDPDISGEINYSITGNAPNRICAISWNQIPLFNCTGLFATQQIVLYESTNIIDINIENSPLCISWNNGNSVIGIQDSTGTFGFTPPGRNTSPWTTQNEAWRFIPNCILNYTLNWYANNVLLGSGLSINVAPHHTTTYLAELTYDNCSSSNNIYTDSTIVSVNNSNSIMPTVISPIIYCQNATATALLATGNNLLWYTSSNGGAGLSTAPTPVTTNIGTTSYFVSQTINSCEGPRAQIDVIINSIPATPTVTTPIYYCKNAAATALTATGSNLLWYTTPTGGVGSVTSPIPITTSVDTIPYFVSQTINGCESSLELINVITNAPPATPTVTTPVFYCQNAIATALTATGSNLLWYTTTNGGTGVSASPIPVTTSVDTIPYYVSQTVNGCESPQTIINIITNALPAAPGVTTPVSYCQNATAIPLSATGSNLLWYTIATGGTGFALAPTPVTNSVDTVPYYVSQTVNGCESPLASINVITIATPATPLVTSPISYCQGVTASALTATGSDLLWYTVTTGGTSSIIAPTPITSSADTISYFVSQTINGCESPRATIEIYTDPLPPAPIITQDGDTLFSNSLIGDQWYDQNGPLIGENNPSLIVLSSGDYYIITTQNGCSSDSSNNITVFFAPATQAFNIGIANVTDTSFDVTWSSGSKGKCALFVKQDIIGSAFPVNNTTYFANPIFGFGNQINTSGWYCVYNDYNTNVNITGLLPATKYRVMACEYNGIQGSEQYNISPSTNNPLNQITNFTTGIINYLQNELFIYPNPTSSEVTLFVPSKTQSIQIINSLGQIVLQRNGNSQTSYSFSLNSSGIYFVQVTTEKQTIIKKLIVCN